MPRPSKGYHRSGGGGGGLLKNLFGGAGDFSENTFFDDPSSIDPERGLNKEFSPLATKPYKDDRGFINRLFGATNTAAELNAALALQKSSIPYTLQTEQGIQSILTKELANRAKNIADAQAAKQAVEDEALARAYGTFLSSYNEATPLQLNGPLSLAETGSRLRNIYGGGPLMQSVSGGESGQAINFLARDKAKMDAGLLPLLQDTKEGELMNLLTKQGLESQLFNSPEFGNAYRKNAVGKLYKELDRTVNQGDTIFGGAGDRYTGVLPEEKLEMVGGIRDPKTGVMIGAQPKVTKSYRAGQHLPPISPEEVSAFKGRSFGIEDSGDREENREAAPAGAPNAYDSQMKAWEEGLQKILTKPQAKGKKYSSFEDVGAIGQLLESNFGIDNIQEFLSNLAEWNKHISGKAYNKGKKFLFGKDTK